MIIITTPLSDDLKETLNKIGLNPTSTNDGFCVSWLPAHILNLPFVKFVDVDKRYFTPTLALVIDDMDGFEKGVGVFAEGVRYANSVNRDTVNHGIIATAALHTHTREAEQQIRMAQERVQILSIPEYEYALTKLGIFPSRWDILSDKDIVILPTDDTCCRWKILPAKELTENDLFLYNLMSWAMTYNGIIGCSVSARYGHWQNKKENGIVEPVRGDGYSFDDLASTYGDEFCPCVFLVGNVTELFLAFCAMMRKGALSDNKLKHGGWASTPRLALVRTILNTLEKLNIVTITHLGLVKLRKELIVEYAIVLTECNQDNKK